MSKASKSDKDTSTPLPVKPLRPKRGAFPTPKSEIDKAPPYIPEHAPDDERPATPPAPSTDHADTQK